MPSFEEHVAVRGKAGVYVVYLDVWERQITHLEDHEIKEVALGGVDTATRTKIIWQVKALRVPDEIENYNCSMNGHNFAPKPFSSSRNFWSK